MQTNQVARTAARGSCGPLFMEATTMKRMLLSMGLVMALLLTLTVPVGAVTDSPAENGAVSVENNYDGSGTSLDAPTSEEGTAEEPKQAAEEPCVFDVQIPDTMKLIFNPYRMNAVFHGMTVNDAVISDTVFIISRESQPLLLNISVTGTPEIESKVSPVSAPEELGGDGKEAFVWFEFQPFIEGEEPVWSESYTGAENQIAVNADERTVTLSDIQGGANCLILKAFGELNVPSGVLWETKDTIQFNVHCKFDAVDLEESDVEEPVDAIDEASGVEEPVDIADDASSVEEPVDVADEASDVEEPVDVTDDASSVEEPVDVADDASDVEEAVDVTDDASDVEEAVDVADEASDVEEVVDVADEVSDVEEPVDVANEVSDVEEVVDVADEVSDVEEAVVVTDEASDV
jgi:hypothetical protein